MKFTLEWLREFLEGDASDEALIEKLTAIGLEVESVASPGALLQGFVVAGIVDAKPHPQADRLRVCKVDNGSEILDVVCGAPNARAGIKVALAPVGVTVPASGITIKRSKIRGEESCGMLCSGAELGLGEDGEGIIELPATAVVGSPLADALGLSDVVVEIGLTPNRGDCFGVYGIARDLAAAGLGTLKPVSATEIKGHFDAPIAVSIAPDSACGAFYGCYVKNVDNSGALPFSMARRLRAIGQRSISPAVDLTNYLLHEFGRPAHVFDADTLQGDLCVRLAVPEESFTALDGAVYRLPACATVVADSKGVHAVGGIIGGAASGCMPTTRNVFVEIALFDAPSVAKTGRLLNMHTESRKRFERGVDADFAETALRILAGRIAAHCGGHLSRPIKAVRGNTLRREAAPFRAGAVKRLTGMDISDVDADAILRKLGFFPASDAAGYVPPSWRHDVTCEADLVEEVARIVGYDAIPETLLPPVSTAPAPHPLAAATAKATFALLGRGLREALCWSFISDAQKEAFGFSNMVTIGNPISQEWRHMRPSLLPNLLRTVAENAGRRLSDFGLCETGTIFFGTSPADQRKAAASIRVGRREAAPGELVRPECTTFDAKRDFFSVLSECGVKEESCRIDSSAPSYLWPGRSASVYLGKTLLGVFGEMHPRLCAGEGVKERVAACEIYIDALPVQQKKGKAARPPLYLSPYQASDRDFCFVMDEKIEIGELTRRIGKADKENVESVRVFDVYRGENVGEGKKSVAVAVRIRPQHKVLTDDDLQRISSAVTAAAEKCGAALRA
ncbi:MAG: phenylalanine--tRNA ligase subunit beta [Rickettsiales bacterium]